MVSYIGEDPGLIIWIVYQLSYQGSPLPPALGLSQNLGRSLWPQEMCPD